MSKQGQIFQTTNPNRWRNFKWGIRIFLITSLFFVMVLVVALVRGINPSMPLLAAKSKAYETKMDPTDPLSFNTKYKGFKAFLNKKIKEDSIKNLRSVTAARDSSRINPYIRSAFYDPAFSGAISLIDLDQNADKLNTIFPEWFFIDTAKFTLQTRIDTAGFALMKKNNLRILPILNDYNSKRQVFDYKLLYGILNDGTKRAAFIKQVADTLLHYNLQGINIDFENLDQKGHVLLENFQKELYEALHPKGLTITMDVNVMNQTYDYKKLSAYNDYLVLMAYDEHSHISGPGPISSEKWIEEAVDWAAKRINPEKIILGIGGYGYDWATDDEGKTVVTPITYNYAINKARVSNATIDYDNTNYNLHFSYTEEQRDTTGGKDDVEEIKHELWFTDAATTFNILRFSDEYATAGTAFWRIGSEDSRIWTYYNKDLSNDALEAHPFDFNSLEKVPILENNVGFEGEGEVLNIVAIPQEGKINLEIDNNELLIAEQSYVQLPSGYIIQRFAEDSVLHGPGHKLVLTFDDGPDERWTPQVLDILEREKAPAAFFLVGIQAEKNIPLVQRIYKEGFEIGNHTFTHSNVAKMSIQRAELEMKLTRLLIESITGHSTILFRAPYNADSEPQTYEELEPIARSRLENYLTIGESIDPNDWAEGITADTIISRIIQQVEARDASIILLHDAGGETRQATIDALPRIIDTFRKKGYVFTTLADLMGKTKADLMPAIPATRDSWLVRINFFFAEATYWGGQIVFALFLVGIVLSISRMFIMALLAWMQKKKKKRPKQ